MAKGTITYYWNAFSYVFMMQALFGLVVNGAALYITKNSGSALALTDYIGLGVAASGLLIESVADWQLSRHIANPDKNKGKFC
jgi:steroid 5-alpha reductase family enzyme